MGKCNSDDHYIYFYGQEFLKRNWIALIVKKKKKKESLKCSTWVRSQKRQNDLCSFRKQTIQYHNNPVYAPNSNAEEAEIEWFCNDLQTFYN